MSNLQLHLTYTTSTTTTPNCWYVSSSSPMKDMTVYDAKRQGPARRFGPGPQVHFRAVSYVTGISGIFRFILPFLTLRAQFSSESPEILHENS